jgi:hypothetical protein
MRSGRNEIRVVGLKQGDENTSFFQNYANMRKNKNIIWELRKSSCEMVSSHKEIVEERVRHFEKLCKEPFRVNIIEVVSLSSYLPRLINGDQNNSLMEEVSKETFKMVVHSFQRDKSHGLDGWPIDFFISFFNLIESDLLKVVEESRKNATILGIFKAMSLIFIPTKDSSSSFEYFRDIVLCNSIYKIMEKVISMHLMSILS